MQRRTIQIGNVKIGPGQPLALIAGPCVIETLEMSINVASRVKDMTDKLGMPYIFKSSYDKSNRSRVDYYRGPGLDKGLEILAEVKKKIGIPVESDVHCREEIAKAKDVLDIIQIPAFLCQQTDLVVSAAKTGCTINVKKGQFLAPEDTAKIVAKIESTGNHNVFLTERGTTFGYHNLVMDIRSIPIMQSVGCPVVVDVTHIVRIPGPTSQESSGGQPQFTEVLARAAVAAGADALFLEVHPDPSHALCDAASQLPLDRLEQLLEVCIEISNIVSNRGKK